MVLSPAVRAKLHLVKKKKKKTDLNSPMVND